MDLSKQIVDNIKKRNLSNDDMIDIALGVVSLLHFRCEILTDQLEKNGNGSPKSLILLTWFLTRFEVIATLLADLSENEEAKEELSNIFPWDEKLDDYEASLDDA
tara:strand:+ start:345 stop:659 length:315 start_codon:yes stop_codon:yes gene_type:complete